VQLCRGKPDNPPAGTGTVGDLVVGAVGAAVVGFLVGEGAESKNAQFRLINLI
jgi:uncharacterized membrane protein YeaQ/YmgE (transglycosylase-associated protein family)